MEKIKNVEETQLIFGNNNIIYVAMGGRPDNDVALNIKSIVLDFINASEDKVNFLVDLNKVGQPSSEARKIFKDLQEHNKVSKTALFGIHTIEKILASFVMSVSKKGNQRFFSTKEEALTWLKS